MNSLGKKRIESIDLLKGLVMVLMALDHTRDYFYQSSSLLSMTDPVHATWPAYLTRWITHFCAPGFSLLAGISAFLVGQRKSAQELSLFLWKRGCWLVLINFTLVNFAWYFDVGFHNIEFGVIWSLGVSMIFLAAIIHLSRNGILILSMLLIFGHNLLDDFHFQGSVWWRLLHELGAYPVSDTRQLQIVYPLIPWIGVMALGYYVGGFYTSTYDPGRRRRWFNMVGIASVLLFLVLRWTNVYGDLSQWRYYDTSIQTMMSFANLTKYPPSLLFLLMTLGITLLVLANTESVKGKWVGVISTFGRVPFFYYIIHLYVIRGLALLVAGLTGHGWGLMIQTTFDTDLKDFGFNLGIVYLIWIGIVVLIYPLCRWFDTYKQNHREWWWVSYL